MFYLDFEEKLEKYDTEIQSLIKLKRSPQNFKNFFLKAKQSLFPYQTPSSSTQSLQSLSSTSTDTQFLINESQDRKSPLSILDIPFLSMFLFSQPIISL